MTFIKVNKGKAKASVLPLPVGAKTNRFFYWKNRGIVIICTGVGFI